MKKNLNDSSYFNGANASNADPYLPPTNRRRKTRRGPVARFFRASALLFALLVVALASFAGYFYWRSVSAPIDVDSASTGQLVGWIALRDLSVETPETRERLFERCVETLGGTDGVVEPEKIELPPQAQRFARLFFAERAAQRQEEKEKEEEQDKKNKENKENKKDGTAQVAGKNKSEEEANAFDFEEKRQNAKRTDDDATSRTSNVRRVPYLRLDYYVAPRRADSTATSRFVLSDDVRPGPALLKRWRAAREADANNGGKKKKEASAVEKNVRLFAMQWFVAKRRAYDKTPDDEKQRAIENAIDELLGWQELYQKIKRDATQKSAPRSEMLAEFEKTVESWNEIETPSELAKTLWFKDLIVANIARRESPLGKLTTPEPPRARHTQRVPVGEGVKNDETAPVDAAETAPVDADGERSGALRDAVAAAREAARRFLFGTDADAETPAVGERSETPERSAL